MAGTSYKYIWVTFEEAKRLKGLIDYAIKNSDLEPDVKERLGTIKSELNRVRDIDYGDLPGHQIILTEKDANIFNKVYDLYEQGIIME